MTQTPTDEGIVALDAPASLLGESPLWHPSEQVLYWCDIPGRALHRFDPTTARHDQWRFATDVACCAPMRDGGLLLAMRDGLWRFDARAAARHALIAHRRNHERTFNMANATRGALLGRTLRAAQLPVRAGTAVREHLTPWRATYSGQRPRMEP